MSETTQTTVQPVQATTPQVGGTQATPVINVQTPVDTNAIVSQAEQKAVEAAEKKMEAVFKSMLSQQGLDSESINAMTAEWKAKQVTPDMQIQELQNKLAESNAKIATFEKHTTIQSYGVTDPEDIEVLSIRIDRLVTDKKDFKTVAKEYFDKHPYQNANEPDKEPPPKGALYIGSTPNNNKNNKQKPPINYTQQLFGYRK